MSFHYHYCATVHQKHLHLPDLQIDGILIVNEKILNMDAYQSVKSIICGDFFDPKCLHISSLSFLHETPVQATSVV